MPEPVYLTHVIMYGQMVHDLGKALEGRVEVIDCMVDRICVDREIREDAIAVSPTTTTTTRGAYL